MTLIQKGFLGAKPDFIKNSLLTSIESRLGKHLNSSVNPLVSVQRASFVCQLFQNAHAFFVLNLRGIHSHFPELFRFFSTTTCVPVLDISTYITRWWLNRVNHDDSTNKTIPKHPCVVVLLRRRRRRQLSGLERGRARWDYVTLSTRIEYGVVTEQRGYLRMGAATLREHARTCSIGKKDKVRTADRAGATRV